MTTQHALNLPTGNLMTPERLAEIRKRANASVDGWPLYVTAPTTGAVDCRELLAYVDELRHENEQLTARLTNPCDGNDCENDGSAHCHACPEAMENRLISERDVALAERDQARAIARGADREWSIRYRDTNGETWVSDLRFTEAGARHEASLGFDSTIEHVEAVYRRLGLWTGADDALPDWLTDTTNGD